MRSRLPPLSSWQKVKIEDLAEFPLAILRLVGNPNRQTAVARIFDLFGGDHQLAAGDTARTLLIAREDHLLFDAHGHLRGTFQDFSLRRACENRSTPRNIIDQS